MQEKWIIWHNPRCSKSRAALKELESRGIESEIRRYLEDSPSSEEIKEVLEMANLSAKDLIRSKEEIYKELGLKSVNDEEELIAAMAEHPRLIERPVVIHGRKAVLARPLEEIDKLFAAE